MKRVKNKWPNRTSLPTELENLYVTLSDQFQDTTVELQGVIERSTQEALKEYHWVRFR